jgi:SAM-dependent MidA family methyltransferase
VITLDDEENFIYDAASDPTPGFEALLPPLVKAAPLSAIFEWRPDTEIMALARRVRDQRGAALVVDYGHVRSDVGDTFQAIARHSFADPLKTPGLADITAHVDFDALSRAAEAVGAHAHGPVTQGEFLQRLGIETRALTLMQKASHEVSEDIANGLKRLIGGGRGGMGSLFKVLGISDPGIPMLAGLSDDKTN